MYRQVLLQPAAATAFLPQADGANDQDRSGAKEEEQFRNVRRN